MAEEQDFNLTGIGTQQDTGMTPPMSGVLPGINAQQTARRILGKPGAAITELMDPEEAQAPTIKPITLPAGSPSSTEKDRGSLISSMFMEVPEELTDFKQVLTAPPGSQERAKRKQGRKKKNPTAGAPKNKSILLKPKPGVMLPPVRIGKQKVDDWIGRVESILTEEEIADAAKWYRSGKMLQPFLRSVGPADTPEIESGFLVGSQQKSPAAALMSYLRQREQARRGVKFEDRRKSGQQDAPLYQIAKGEQVTGGAGQKIYDFYDSAMQNPTRTFYANDPGAGKPFVVDVHSFRDMGYIDDTYKKFLEEHYVIPKGFTIQVDQPVGAPQETQYEAAADAGRSLTAQLNKMGYGDKLGLGELQPPDVQAIGWIALSRLYGAQGQDVPEAIERNIQRVSAELSFGEGAPYNEQFSEFANLSAEEQYRVTREAMAWVGDRANELAGTLNVGRVHGSGGWQNYPPSPAMVETLLSTPEGADLYANIVGYLAQQTEVWAVKQVTTASAQANGVAVDILEEDSDRITKGANLINVWNEINQFNPEVFQGYQPIIRDGKPGIRVIVPFEFSPFKSKQKLRDYIDENADALGTTIDNVFPGDANFTINPVDVNIRYNQNDWTQNPDGKSHLQRISETGGQALADSIRDRHRPEFEAFLRNSLGQASLRTGGQQGIPDTKDFSRAIPERRRLVLPGDAGENIFGDESALKDALKDYESARQIQNPILDSAKRKHNFDRWWNWDFEKNQAGDTPSAATFELFYDEKEGDFTITIGPEQIYNNRFGTSTAEDLNITDPMIFYHGSPNFQGTRFDPDKQGLRDHGYLGKGFYFTPKPQSAERYAESTDEMLAAQDDSGPVAKVFADPSQVGSDELTEQIDEFTMDDSEFYESDYPKTAAGLKQFAEDQYADQMAVVQMDEKTFAPEIMPFYLSIKKPLNLNPGKLTDEMIDQLEDGFNQAMTYTSHNLTKEKAEEMFERLRTIKNDPGNKIGFSQRITNYAEFLGIDMSELAQEAGFDAIVGGGEVVVFNPKQIKSAQGNIGLFNPESDDFLTQLEKPMKKRNEQLARLQAPQIMGRTPVAA